MNKPLSKKEAAKFLEDLLTRPCFFLKLDDKTKTKVETNTTFDNYFQNADEFKCATRESARGRYYFIKDDLAEWATGFKWRSVELTLEDYSLCLDFALAMHFRGYVLSDWGTARQREFGQKITNWVKGQLAEVAVKKFFRKEFDIDVELDFGIHNEIVPQDIIGVVEKGEVRQPKIGIGIKSSKPKSAYLVLSENEITRKERKSDFYILCRPDIPDDHLLRLTKNRVIEVVKSQQHFPTYKDEMPDFTNMYCEIAGWCRIDELEKVTSIPGQEFDGVRYVKKSGQLHKNKESWQELLNLL